AGCGSTGMNAKGKAPPITCPSSSTSRRQRTDDAGPRRHRAGAQRIGEPPYAPEPSFRRAMSTAAPTSSSAAVAAASGPTGAPLSGSEPSPPPSPPGGTAPSVSLGSGSESVGSGVGVSVGSGSSVSGGSGSPGSDGSSLTRNQLSSKNSSGSITSFASAQSMSSWRISSAPS